MESRQFFIGDIPALLYGAPSDRVWLFLHGQQGRKEEALPFAYAACPRGAQVLAVDLPGHGARRERGEDLTPWAAEPELRAVQAYLDARWRSFSLRANSIGAYFAMLALDEPDRALLVSPVLDMEGLIRTMMGWAGVTEERLRREGEIPTSFGETLSWDYLCYVRSHPVRPWRCPVEILWGGQDHLIARETVEAFADRQGARLTVVEEGEHWFHTPEQLEALRRWESERV